jgi:hypothetical protein
MNILFSHQIPHIDIVPLEQAENVGPLPCGITAALVACEAATSQIPRVKPMVFWAVASSSFNGLVVLGKSEPETMVFYHHI